jgi:hypothetical protein
VLASRLGTELGSQPLKGRVVVESSRSQTREPDANASGVQLRLVPSADSFEIPIVYSNFAQVTVSPHDLTFHFGYYAIPAFTEPPQGVVDVPVRPMVKVTLPLSLVRNLIHVLEAQAEQWEGNFGQPLPAEPSSPAESGQEKTES